MGLPVIRRTFLKRCGAAVLAGSQLTGEEANIRWGLGAVTWVVKAGAASPKWEDVLGDIHAAGFDGVEAYTTKTFPVNDANMSRLEELLPRYRPLRLSAI